MALGAKVKELRYQLRWNQITLAKKAGISNATISRLENKTSNYQRIGNLQKLAEALGTTIDYLTGDDDKRRATMEVKIEALVSEIQAWSMKGVADNARVTAKYDSEDGSSNVSFCVPIAKAHCYYVGQKLSIMITSGQITGDSCKPE